MSKQYFIDRELDNLIQSADHAVFGQISRKGDKEEDNTADKISRAARANQILENHRILPPIRRGRGAALNPKARFEKFFTEPSAEALEEILAAGENLPKRRTQVQEEKPRAIISRNDSDDIPFDLSVNPYRGCEHGCIYCYARPSHAYMGLSAGLDFESQLFAKPTAAHLLRKELAHPAYKPKIIAMGSNTDPYQPIEKQYQITRSILEVLFAARHPLTITTKSALILRDSDILAALAQEKLVHVALSVETLDAKLARLMDPRASTPAKRLQAVAQLTALQVPVSVMMAPVIPALTDHEIEAVAAAAAKAGAQGLNYTLLRLPYEVAPLFKDWLLREYPDKYRRVIGQLRMMRNGRDNDATAHNRMRGSGVMAKLLAQRFQMAAKAHGLNRQSLILSHDLFQIPAEWRQTEANYGSRNAKKGEENKKRQEKMPKQLSFF